MPLIEGDPVNYGNGNALSIALPIFSNLSWLFLGRPIASEGFKPTSEFRRNQETELSALYYSVHAPQYSQNT